MRYKRRVKHAGEGGIGDRFSGERGCLFEMWPITGLGDL